MSLLKSNSVSWQQSLLGAKARLTAPYVMSTLVCAKPTMSRGRSLKCRGGRQHPSLLLSMWFKVQTSLLPEGFLEKWIREKSCFRVFFFFPSLEVFSSPFPWAGKLWNHILTLPCIVWRRAWNGGLCFSSWTLLLCARVSWCGQN